MRAAAAALVAAAVLAPVSAQAQVLPSIPGVPSIPGITGSTSCKSSPTPRTSASGISAIFDGTPADTGGNPPTSTYEQFGVHPFAWSLYDPGCGGVITQPTALIDTWIGNQLLGAATDLVALGNGVHSLAARPTWLGIFDRMETNVVGLLKSRVWDVTAPLSFILLGVIILTRSHRGDMAAALKMAAWAALVLLIVSFVAAEPVKVGHLADQAETTSINSVNAGLAGSGNTGPAAAGSLEVQAVLYPNWLAGEVGSATGTIADRYGPKLLDSQAYKWSEQTGGAPTSSDITDRKNAEFASAASAIHDASPGAYEGQAGGRAGAGFMALAAAAITVPFRLTADLLVAASLILLRLIVMILPLVAVLGLHERFAPLVRGTAMAGIAALINAFVFSCASAINTLAVSFLLGPSSGIPAWFGLILAALFAFLCWYALRPFRRLTHMVPLSAAAGEVKAKMHQIHGVGVDTARTAVRAGVVAATGGAAAEVVAADVVRESVADHDHQPEVPVPMADQPLEDDDPVAAVLGDLPAPHHGVNDDYHYTPSQEEQLFDDDEYIEEAQ
jgi:hypothetical protein